MKNFKLRGVSPHPVLILEKAVETADGR